jgi:hypothetical protein
MFYLLNRSNSQSIFTVGFVSMSNLKQYIILKYFVDSLSIVNIVATMLLVNNTKIIHNF